MGRQSSNKQNRQNDMYSQGQKCEYEKLLKNRYTEKRKEIPTKVFCNTFDVPLQQEIKPSCNSTKKSTQTEQLEVVPKQKKYLTSLGGKFQKRRCKEIKREK